MKYFNTVLLLLILAIVSFQVYTTHTLADRLDDAEAKFIAEQKARYQLLGDTDPTARAGNLAQKNEIPSTTIAFEENYYDFGPLVEGDKVSHVFKYKNTGDKPLYINNAQGSCGCTVPEWDTAAIAPGAIGTLKVTFDSKGKLGNNDKTVTINANTEPPITRLTIAADVTRPSFK